MEGGLEIGFGTLRSRGFHCAWVIWIRREWWRERWAYTKKDGKTDQNTPRSQDTSLAHVGLCWAQCHACVYGLTELCEGEPGLWSLALFFLCSSECITLCTHVASDGAAVALPRFKETLFKLPSFLACFTGKLVHIHCFCFLTTYRSLFGYLALHRTLFFPKSPMTLSTNPTTYKYCLNFMSQRYFSTVTKCWLLSPTVLGG